MYVDDLSASLRLHIYVIRDTTKKKEQQKELTNAQVKGRVQQLLHSDEGASFLV